MTQISPLPFHQTYYPIAVETPNEENKFHPLFERVGLNLETLVTGFGLVIAIGGISSAILAGAFSTAIGFLTLGAIVVYNFYEGLEVVVLNKAIETLKLSKEHLTQTCFDLRKTSSDLEISTKILRSDVDKLQILNQNLMAHSVQLAETNQALQVTKQHLSSEVTRLSGEVGTMQKTNVDLQNTLGGYQYQLHIIHNGAKIFQDNVARIQQTDQALQATQQKLAATQMALDLIEKNLAQQNKKYADLNLLLANQLYVLTTVLGGKTS